MSAIFLETKKNRSQAKVAQCLSKLKKAAEGKDNLIPHTITAVESGVTLGEVSDTFRDVFGNYNEHITL